MIWLKTVLFELRRIWPLLAVIAVALLIFGDPAQLAVQLYQLSMAALVLIAAHHIRKAMFPYLDLSQFVREAKDGNLAAAVVVAAVIALISVLILATTTMASEIPERARPHLPTLAAALDTHWPQAPHRHLAAGQVEQESGWKERATLKTSRELGRGLAQLTIAYDAQGAERFNTYRDAVRHKSLAAWDWRSDPYNPRYQLAYLVLRDRAEWAAMRMLMVDDLERWKSALVCYNAGRGRVLARRAYALAAGLPADRWSGGLDLAHGPSEDRLLYGRPLWQAVNEYPRKVVGRAEKYRGAV
jgi:hypothetical protein